MVMNSIIVIQILSFYCFIWLDLIAEHQNLGPEMTINKSLFNVIYVWQNESSFLVRIAILKIFLHSPI